MTLYIYTLNISSFTR